MQGVYKIGPGNTYTSINTALTAIKNNGLSGPVILEITNGYVDIGETLYFTGNIPCVSAVNTITLRPEIGATNKRIATSNSVIIFGNSKYVTIDGRPGGVGSNIELSIVCSGSNTNAILFTSNSTNNIIQYTNISAAIPDINSGAIAFTGGANNNNEIKYCNVSSNNYGVPANCIYAQSTTQKNINNKIQNCNVTGFGTNGIYLGKNSADWDISSNSFYSLSNYSNINVSAIYIKDTTSANSVTSNFIGGSGPQCTGLPSTFTNGGFNGIYIAAGKTSYSNIQNNLIKNFEWRGTSSAYKFAGIHMVAGKINCGTILGNIIGSQTQNASILSTTSYLNSSVTAGILIDSWNSASEGYIDTINITNNIIAGIKSAPQFLTDQTSRELFGIFSDYQKTGYLNISNNFIGSSILTKSLESTDENGSIVGIKSDIAANGPIWSDTYPIYNNISGNTITSINSYDTKGIYVIGGKPQVKNNIIKDFIITQIDSFAISSIYGIYGLSLIDSSKFEKNQIFSIGANDTWDNQHSGFSGIYLSSSKGVEISKNYIHHINIQHVSGVATIIGIESTSFTSNIKIINNVINFGFDNLGNPINQQNQMTGISAVLDSSVVTHNSVFIGGSGMYGEINALFLSKINNKPCRVTNNILSIDHNQLATNLPSYSFAIKFNPLTTVQNSSNTDGLVLNNNLYYVNGTNSFVGSYAYFGPQAYQTFASWQNFIQKDNNSRYGNPNFINGTGGVNNLNMHIALPTLADANGILEPSVLTDIDNENRSLLSPVDIGADAIASAPITPLISSFLPTSAAIGTTITITGLNFTGASAVSFGGIAAQSFTVVSATTITAVVANGSSGNVSVTTSNGTNILSGFTFITPSQSPTITSFSPTSATAGTQVQINGTNFMNVNLIGFGGVSASSFNVISQTQINAIVGTGASGNVSVNTNSGVASLSGFLFNANTPQAPIITSFLPTSASNGSTITINGNNFIGTTSVTLGGVSVTSFVVLSSTKISIVVGIATSGALTVTTPYGTASLGGFLASRNVVTDLILAPNPTKNYFIARYPEITEPNAYLRIANLIGQQVYKIELKKNSTETTVNIQGFLPGAYNVELSGSINNYHSILVVH